VAEKFRVNEVFYSLQGEGVRVGTANVFVRFTGCNMACDVAEGPNSPGGFACDTEFESGRWVTLDELAEWCVEAMVTANCPVAGMTGGYRQTGCYKEPWIVLSGGEPALQVDKDFCNFWHARGVRLAIETNGTVELPQDGAPPSLGTYHMYIDWITVSPKVAEHALKQKHADEVKYVRGYGQALPRPACQAFYKLISPAFDGFIVHPKTLQWCIRMVQENPGWRLSPQYHKLLNVR
jgi:7-carboxy-7-deazaguanine synthase